MSLLLIRTFFGNALSAAFKWLQTASVWQVLCIALLVPICVQHFELVKAHHEAAKWHSQSDKNAALAVNYRRQLDAISTKRNEQTKVTTKTVEHVVQGQVQIRTVVQRIHDAPNPPDCGTPDLVELRGQL